MQAWQAWIEESNQTNTTNICSSASQFSTRPIRRPWRKSCDRQDCGNDWRWSLCRFWLQIQGSLQEACSGWNVSDSSIIAQIGYNVLVSSRKYVRGSTVKVRINSLELSDRFLGSTQDLTLLEADVTLLGFVSSVASKSESTPTDKKAKLDWSLEFEVVLFSNCNPFP